MAGYVQDGGGQQSLHFGYHPEWLSGGNSFGGPADTFNNNQQSILDTNDNAFMNDFWDNPDAAPLTNGIADFNWQGMDVKVDNGEFEDRFDGIHDTAHNIHEPSISLAEISNSRHQTHSSSNLQNLPYRPNLDFIPLEYNQASIDADWKAALDLHNMSMNTQDASQAAQPFDNAAVGSWGTFGSHDGAVQMPDMVKSQETSSGRHSSNSYHNQQQTSAQANYQLHNGQLQHRMMDQLYRQRQMAHHMQHDPRGRHMSLQIEPSSMSLFPHAHAHAQPRTPQSAFPPGQHPGRPPMVHFGSDSNFSRSGYLGPSNQVPIEHEKGANLNNVPLADQLAANGHLHMPPFTPMTPSRSYGQYMFPNGPQTYNNTSTSSSPNTLGGLPTTKMAHTPNHHGHPFNQAARNTAAASDEVDSDEDAEFEETQPRKRRKSQMEAEDDAEYTPGKHHVKAPASRRGSKATKVPIFDGSDDDDDYEEVPSSNKASAKRRKSSTNARPSLASSQSGSPAAMASPTGKPATSGKKKVRGSHPRTNLTEDEKRRNHIASEKTRRDLIKVQYDQLDNMVPSLKQGKSGLSRSDILKEIVSYVETVMTGNEQMEAKLAEFSKSQARSSFGGYE